MQKALPLLLNHILITLILHYSACVYSWRDVPNDFADITIFRFRFRFIVPWKHLFSAHSMFRPSWDGERKNSRWPEHSFHQLQLWTRRLQWQTQSQGWRRTGAWSALTNNVYQWLQVDLRAKTEVTAIKIQGRQDYDQWVKTFTITYSNDGTNFKPYQNGKVWKPLNIVAKENQAIN